MSPKNFGKIAHPEQEKSLYFLNLSKEISQLTDSETYKNIVIIGKECTNIPGMPQKNFRNISPPNQDISLYWPNFCKEVSKVID